MSFAAENNQSYESGWLVALFHVIFVKSRQEFTLYVATHHINTIWQIYSMN